MIHTEQSGDRRRTANGTIPERIRAHFASRACHKIFVYNELNIVIEIDQTVKEVNVKAIVDSSTRSRGARKQRLPASRSVWVYVERDSGGVVRFQRLSVVQ